MNVVVGKQFESLKQKAMKYGAKDLDYSNWKNKKYVVTLKDGENIDFSHNRYEDFLIHKDKYGRKKIEKEQVK